MACPFQQSVRLPSVGAELTAGMSRPVTSRSWAPEGGKDTIIIKSTSHNYPL